MSEIPDRRKQIRTVGQGLVVLVDGKAQTVLNISTNGVSYQSNGQKPGSVISARLARLSRIEDAIDCKIRVVSSDETVARGEFLPTVALMRYIISHIGEATGAEPAYFR